jgi:iron complex transport system substrate-binding protein
MYPRATSRRTSARFLVPTALLCALTLAGCAGGADAKPDSANPATTSAGAGTRTVTDALGNSVKVPKSPQRVVVLNDELLDDTLALGVKPVAITNGQGQSGPAAYLADQVANVPVVGNVNQPEVDKILAAKPDLILMSYVIDKEQLAQLKEIAPTFVVADPLLDFWKDNFGRVATALGKDDKAKAWSAEYDARVVKVTRSISGHAGAPVTIARWNSDGPTTMNTGSFASGIATEVGLTRPANQREKGQGHGPTLSLESLSELDAGWIFISALSATGEDGKALKAGVASKAFSQLPAVKAKHLSVVDGSVWGTGGGPAASLIVLDDLAKALTP